MTQLTIAAVAGHFNRDVSFALTRVDAICDDARERGAQLVVLPDAALGGYLSYSRVERPDPSPLLGPAIEPPPPLSIDGPEVKAVRASAAELVVCFGLCEADGTRRYNTAVCVTGDGVLGVHRKVHLPPADRAVYGAGDGFATFATPVGRLGLLIDYDKTFPEAARALALGGAEIVACLSAWPANVTERAARLDHDRQTRLFNLYDMARAAENQVVWASSNQTGRFGGLRFLGQAKVVGPGGQVLATTGTKAGIALARLDVGAEIARARRSHDHLRERRPSTYGALDPPARGEPPAWWEDEGDPS
jgi:predicted amidohydrolase